MGITSKITEGWTRLKPGSTKIRKAQYLARSSHLRTQEGIRSGVEPILIARGRSSECREGRPQKSSVCTGYALHIFLQVHEGLESAENPSFQVVGQAQAGSDAGEEQATFGNVGGHVRAALGGSLAQGNLAMHFGAGPLDAPGEMVYAEAHRTQFRGYGKLTPGNTGTVIGRFSHSLRQPRPAFVQWRCQTSERPRVTGQSRSSDGEGPWQPTFEKGMSQFLGSVKRRGVAAVLRRCTGRVTNMRLSVEITGD